MKVENMTLQQKMQTTLESTGLPFKKITVYGRQIVITSHSRKAANQWTSVLSQFSTVRGIAKDLDYAKANKGIFSTISPLIFLNLSNGQ